MCGACGVLGGGPEWIDRAGNPDGVAAAPAVTRVAERQRRIALANLLPATSASPTSATGWRCAARPAAPRSSTR